MPYSTQMTYLHNNFLKQDSALISISQIEAKARLCSLPDLTKWPGAKLGFLGLTSQGLSPLF